MSESGTAAAGAIEEARRRWPDVDLADDVFHRYADEKLGGRAGCSAHIVDLWLAAACIEGDRRAIDIFVAGYLRPLVFGGDGASDRRDELQQALEERLLVGGPEGPRLAAYSARGSLRGWLRVVIARFARDRACKKDNADSDPLPPSLVDRIDLELDFLRRRDHGVFKEAFSQAAAELSAQQRTLLRLHFIDGLSSRRLGRLFGAHHGTVARWVRDAREQLASRTEDILRIQCGLDAGGIHSLLRDVQSGFPWSLGRLLAGSGKPY
jgi:RNA polymerase sigma-70 factor (ECF subfamily)